MFRQFETRFVAARLQQQQQQQHVRFHAKQCARAVHSSLLRGRSIGQSERGGWKAGFGMAAAAACGAVVYVYYNSSTHSSTDTEPERRVQVLAWGNNLYGQLGIGNEVNKWLPTEVETLSLSNVKQLSAGGNISAAIIDEGDLVTFGHGAYYALGHRDRSNESLPRIVEGISHVRDVACGKVHMCAVTTDGQVYTWGSGNGGRLGHGDTEDQPVPKRVAAFDKTDPIVRITCGANRSLALTENGEVYQFGHRMFGRFLQDADATPVKVPGLTHVVGFSCGDDHCAAVTADGRVYTWGNDDYGQLGMGKRVASSNTEPSEVSSLRGRKIVAVACGSFHTVALDSAGAVYTWGLGRDGELGHGDTADNRQPKRVQLLADQQIVQIAAGEGHTCCVTSTGELYAFGKGRDGQLGDESVFPRSKPQQVHRLNGSVSSVVCGFNHVLALVQS